MPRATQKPKKQTPAPAPWTHETGLGVICGGRPLVRKTKPNAEETPKKKYGPYRITAEWLRSFENNQYLVAEQREVLRNAMLKNSVEPCEINPEYALMRYSGGDLVGSSR